MDEKHGRFRQWDLEALFHRQSIDMMVYYM